MSAILSIVRREFQAYFVSPIAYTVIVIFLGITGFGFLYSVQAYAAMPEMLIERLGHSIRTFVVRDLANIWMNLAMIFALPGLSMRLLSEERKVGTAELLMTSPLTTAQIVAGKFFGAVSILLVMLALTTPFVGVLVWQAEPELAAIGGAYLGFFLYGSVILAIGVFASALTENQIVALLLTYAMFLPLWLIEMLVGFMGQPWDGILAGLAVGYGLNAFGLGLIDTRYVVLDLGLVFLFLFLCAQVIDSSRWR